MKREMMTSHFYRLTSLNSSMPIYEYQCTKCGHEFDEIQKFSDPPIQKCPKCKGKVEKKLSAPSFQLKGTGWYVTDFKDKAKDKSKKSESKTDNNSENKASTPDKAKPSKVD